jgi:hypothetical protein
MEDLLHVINQRPELDGDAMLSVSRALFYLVRLMLSAPLTALRRAWRPRTCTEPGTSSTWPSGPVPSTCSPSCCRWWGATRAAAAWPRDPLLTIVRAQRSQLWDTAKSLSRHQGAVDYMAQRRTLTVARTQDIGCTVAQVLAVPAAKAVDVRARRG